MCERELVGSCEGLIGVSLKLKVTMEINEQNFISSFDIVKQAVNEADFISFDTEFSGKLLHLQVFRLH